MSGARKALVLGGTTGLLGQALASALEESGWEVRCTGRRDFDATAEDAAGALARLLDNEQPACVFNTIAHTQVDAAEDDPDDAALLNKTLPAMLGNLLKTRPETALVHYSTDFVFNGKKQKPYTTEDRTDPLNVYGATKRAGEEALLGLALPKCLVVRTAWLFGPGKRNFVSAVLGKCREQIPLSIVHDQVGSPTYTPDLARFTLKLVDAGASGLFHIANSGSASWCELAAEAVRLAGLPCTVTPIPSSGYPQKAVRPEYSVLDCSQLERITGCMPRSWPQALSEYIFTDFLS